MDKIAESSDWHLGKNSDTLKYAQEIIDTCIASGVSWLLHGGDLMDTLSTPKLRKEVKDLFQYAVDRGLNILVIRGNHEYPFDLHFLHDIRSESARVVVSEFPEPIDIGPAIVYTIPHFSTGRIKLERPEFNEMTGQQIINAVVDDAVMESKKSKKPSICLVHATIDGGTIDTRFIPKDNGMHIGLNQIVPFNGYVWCGHYHMDTVLAKNVRYIDSHYPHTHAEGGNKKGFWIQEIKDGNLQKPERIYLDVPRIFNIEGSFKENQWVGEIKEALINKPSFYKGAKVKFTYTVREEESSGVSLLEIEKHFEQSLTFEIKQIKLAKRQSDIEITEEEKPDEISLRFMIEKEGLSKKESVELLELKNHLIEMGSMEIKQ